MSMKKLILCDVDSTLTVHHQPITPKTKETILALKEQGYRFGLASGRPIDSLRVMLSLNMLLVGSFVIEPITISLFLVK